MEILVIGILSAIIVYQFILMMVSENRHTKKENDLLNRLLTKDTKEYLEIKESESNNFKQPAETESKRSAIPKGQRPTDMSMTAFLQ